jgi:hypothetical protein
MVQIMNRKSPPAPPRQDDGPAASPRPLARISDRLNRLIEDAVAACPRDSGGRRVRSDGWTPERIRVFLEALTEFAVVEAAARAAGMSKSSAYAYRWRPGGRAFGKAWDGALFLARPALADELMSRAMHGCVEIITRDGEVWGERHRHDNAHARAMLTRLDQQVTALDRESATARLVAENFEEFVDIVCAGGGEAAEAFLRARAEEEAGQDDGPRQIEVTFVSPKDSADSPCNRPLRPLIPDSDEESET